MQWIDRSVDAMKIIPDVRQARHRVSSVARLSRKPATSQCEVILVTGDNIHNISILESRIQSWGLNTIAVRDGAALARLMAHFPTALVCRPRRWEKMPDHPLQACIATHISQDRVISYGPDLWGKGCPEILRNKFAETLDWAVHHG